MRESQERLSGQTGAELARVNSVPRRVNRAPGLRMGLGELKQGTPASTEPLNNKELVPKTGIGCFSVTMGTQSWEQPPSRSEEGEGKELSTKLC